jgi:hypothetical protein
MAALWNYPARENGAGEEIRYDIFETLPGAYAFRMYRNYDGQGGQFGDTGVQAASSDLEKLSIYAAQRSSDSSLTLMIVNKTGNPLDANLSIANYAASNAAQVFRYSAADLNAIQHLADQPISGAEFSTTFPAHSITLLHIPAAAVDQPERSYLPYVQR